MFELEYNTNIFLVLDSGLLTDAGGDMLLTKIPCPHKSMQLTFGPGMFHHVDEGSLLVVNNYLLETLRDAIARAVDTGSFRQCGIVLLVGEEALGSDDALTQMGSVPPPPSHISRRGLIRPSGGCRNS